MRVTVFDLHFGYVFVHQIFACDLEGVGEVVDFLVGVELGVDLEFHWATAPVHSPVLVVLRGLNRDRSTFLKPFYSRSYLMSLTVPFWNL